MLIKLRMSYQDWLANFDVCQICNLTPETVSEISDKDWDNSRLLSNIFSMWQCQFFHGKWISGISAGGRGEPRPGTAFITESICMSLLK